MQPEALFQTLESRFKGQVQAQVALSRFTAARIGGPADLFLTVHSADELADAARLLWEEGAPFVVLGGGSNVLVSDSGYRGVVIFNRARSAVFNLEANPPTLWAESGANLGVLARQAALKGLSGLEWAGGIPGTMGGAVVGNAGAHGGDMAGNLILAEILHIQKGKQTWPVAQLAYSYRSSALKRSPGRAVVLSATLALGHDTPEQIQARMEAYLEKRRQTQPPGASMGSMFKNPPGDYAGRLIEQAGLKGTRVGGAQISPVHANFIINDGQASAMDVYALISLARAAVWQNTGIALELEIELLGSFSVDIAKEWMH